MKKAYLTPQIEVAKTALHTYLGEASQDVIPGGGEGSEGEEGDAKERRGLWGNSDNGGSLW